MHGPATGEVEDSINTMIAELDRLLNYDYTYEQRKVVRALLKVHTILVLLNTKLTHP